MILLIDNYDSFTYNIYQYMIEDGFDVLVKRNDEISLKEIEELAPEKIVLSPGPGNPDSAGICLEVLEHFKTNIPILGICLGHQCIGQAFGGEIVRAGKIVHGKPSVIDHDGRGVFKEVSPHVSQIRYHSLVIRRETLPEELEITANSLDDNEIMGVRHKKYAIEGIQFHPESISSEEGRKILRNFLREDHSDVMKDAIRKVTEGESLTVTMAENVMECITSGKATPAQIGSILTALIFKGETVEELTGFARVMRRSADQVAKPKGRRVLDTCGTGGDKSGTFNISTAVALVTAGAGVTVAKHGNRSVTSKCGSADVLEDMGVPIDHNADKLAENLKNAGIAFLFAPVLHKAMKYAVPVRREIGIRTCFNILGPMTNPAHADYQLIGIFSPELTEKMAHVLMALGIERAMVVHGGDGLDEITLTDKTRISELKDGWVKTYDFDPRSLGFAFCDHKDLKGGDIHENKQIILNILKGERGPKRNIVVINAAAALMTAGKAGDMGEGVRLAEESIDSGMAMKKLEALIQSGKEKIHG